MMPSWLEAVGSRAKEWVNSLANSGGMDDELLLGSIVVSGGSRGKEEFAVSDDDEVEAGSMMFSRTLLVA